MMRKNQIEIILSETKNGGYPGQGLFLLVLVLAALTVFCSAAFAQYGYAVPTLETVRRDGSTANVYTYRDANGNKIRETEFYVNDDGSYGNLDV